MAIAGPNGKTYSCFACLGFQLLWLFLFTVRAFSGDTCVEVIDKCGCASSCYRASSMEHIYDFVSPMDDETTDSPVIKVRFSI